MLTQEDIKILREMMQEEIGTLKNELTEKIEDVKAELTEKIDDVKEDTMHYMRVLIESHVMPQVKLLAEGHQSILERTVSRDEYELTKEEFNDRLIVLEITAKSTVREIEKLKKAT